MGRGGGKSNPKVQEEGVCPKSFKYNDSKLDAPKSILKNWGPKVEPCGVPVFVDFFAAFLVFHFGADAVKIVSCLCGINLACTVALLRRRSGARRARFDFSLIN